MVRLMKIAAFAGCALAVSVYPALAQDLALPVFGSLDLDPFHIFTPAPPPAAAPAEHHHHHHVHHLHGHHHAYKH